MEIHEEAMFQTASALLTWFMEVAIISVMEPPSRPFSGTSELELPQNQSLSVVEKLTSVYALFKFKPQIGKLTELTVTFDKIAPDKSIRQSQRISLAFSDGVNTEQHSFGAVNHDHQDVFEACSALIQDLRDEFGQIGDEQLEAALTGKSVRLILNYHTA